MTYLGAYVELQKLLAQIRRRSPETRVPPVESLSATRDALAQALGELPERWQAIILRCDLGGELHTAVAADLGISKRHFYREREKALTAVGAVLGSASPSARASVTQASDQHIAVTAVVNPLLNTRRVGEAVGVIENALGQVESAPVRVRLLLKLSGVHCQLRTLQPAADALHLAGQAIPHGEMDADTRQALQLDFATEEANLLRYQHNPTRARLCLQQAVRHCAGTGLAGPQAQRSFADAHLALSNLLGTQDEYAAAVGHASEAERLLRDAPLDVSMRSRLETQLACFRFFGGMATSQSVLLDLQVAYAIAQRNGLAMDALQAVTALSLLHSFADRHRDAIEYGKTGVAITQTVGLRDEAVTGAHYMLASAQVAAGDIVGATQTLSEVVTSQSKHPWSRFPFTAVLRARVLLAGGRHGEALRFANEAIDTFEESGNLRWHGTALKLRAMIEEALGDDRSARASVDDAISLLESGAPSGMLGSAYELSAALTGNGGHLRTARDMLARASLLPTKSA